MVEAVVLVVQMVVTMPYLPVLVVLNGGGEFGPDV